jgi:hypothetical protein
VRLNAFANLFDCIGGYLGQVVEALDITRLNSDGAPMTLEKRDVPGCRHGLEKTVLLQCTQLVA